jgi:glutathione synthase/RimK-type ligase-like ATP-grasp enzyme
MILIATHRRATEADRLLDQLRADGRSVVRVNMGPQESESSVVFGPGGSVQFSVLCDGRRIDGAAITAAWYHQPPIVSDSSSSGGRAGRIAAATSLDSYWTCALEMMDCRWLNDPKAVQASAQKLRQLLVATEVELPVPEGSCGNDPQAVRAMQFPATVAKNIADLHLAWGEDPSLAFLTCSVDPESLADGQIASVPVLYQERVRAEREYRVVMVDGQPFSAAIAWSDRRNVVDVRTAEDALGAYQPTDLPQETAEGLRAVLGHFGLGYCSADLVEGEDGVVRLLDLNACGAWWWVDDLFGGSVTEALSKKLGEMSEE